MHHFSIQDIENLSGIKAHTLRMWEQRYQVCLCKRKESQHRYYDNDDLKHILRIAHLYKTGHKISRIIQLSQEDIVELAAKTPGDDEYQVLVNQLVEACIDYNQDSFEKSLDAVKNNMGLEKSIEKVIYPFLKKMGVLWMTGHVLPAQEHFCSYLVKKFILAATESLPPVAGPNKHRVLLFTPEGEQHDLPILFVQYIARKKGLKTVLMGTSISFEILQDYCNLQPVTHLYFHLITNFTNCSAQVYINKLAKCFAEKQIIASGPALAEIEKLPVNVRLMRSLQEVMEFELFPSFTF